MASTLHVGWYLLSKLCFKKLSSKISFRLDLPCLPFLASIFLLAPFKERAQAANVM